MFERLFFLHHISSVGKDSWQRLNSNPAAAWKSMWGTGSVAMLVSKRSACVEHRCEPEEFIPHRLQIIFQKSSNSMSIFLFKFIIKAKANLNPYLYIHNVEVCLHFLMPSPSRSPSQFIIVPMVTDTLTGRMGAEPILPVTVDKMINRWRCRTCEQTLTVEHNSNPH